MSNENAKQGLGFVFGLLVGSLIGASTAIILAPASGTQTRELLKQKATEAKTLAAARAIDLKEKATTRAAEVKELASAKAAEYKEDLGEWTEKAKSKVVSKFRERMSKATSPETVGVPE